MILVLATVLLLCALLTGSIGRVFCWDTTQRHAAGRASMTTLALLLVFGGFFGPSHTVAAALPALGVVPSILAASTASGELQAGREVSPAALVPRGGAGAESAANALRLRNQLSAREIASGHAFEKHVIQRGEFPVSTHRQFGEVIEGVLNRPTHMRELARGRTAFFDGGAGVLVIRNPAAPHGGTV